MSFRPAMDRFAEGTSGAYDGRVVRQGEPRRSARDLPRGVAHGPSGFVRSAYGPSGRSCRSPAEVSARDHLAGGLGAACHLLSGGAGFGVGEVVAVGGSEVSCGHGGWPPARRGDAAHPLWLPRRLGALGPCWRSARRGRPSVRRCGWRGDLDETIVDGGGVPAGKPDEGSLNLGRQVVGVDAGGGHEADAELGVGQLAAFAVDVDRRARISSGPVGGVWLNRMRRKPPEGRGRGPGSSADN